MRAGATLPVAANGCPVFRPLRRRAKEEELMQRELALENVSLREPGDALDVGRREHLPVENERLDVRRVPRNRLHHGVAKGLAFRSEEHTSELQSPYVI